MTSAIPGRSESLVPFTHGRAATELIQSWRHVAEARTSLELALEIFSALDDPATRLPLQSLYQVLGQLEESEAVLWEVRTPAESGRPSRSSSAA
jgi:hypothetical protein